MIEMKQRVAAIEMDNKKNGDGKTGELATKEEKTIESKKKRNEIKKEEPKEQEQRSKEIRQEDEQQKPNAFSSFFYSMIPKDILGVPVDEIKKDLIDGQSQIKSL